MFSRLLRPVLLTGALRVQLAGDDKSIPPPFNRPADEIFAFAVALSGVDKTDAGIGAVRR